MPKSFLGPKIQRRLFLINRFLIKQAQQVGQRLCASNLVKKFLCGVKKGVKIIGTSNVMNKLPITASSLYAKNVFSFIRNLYSKEKKQFVVNMEDEIIKNTLIKAGN